MKKRLVMLLAGLLTVLSMGFGLAQFSDVPAGHWAKEAVEALAAKGIIVGFPDGTFRGNEGLTRYQAALIIYRLLQQIQEELKAKGESPTMEALSPEELEALKNAVQELAAELAALGVRVSALEDSAATKEDIARLEALIAELKAQPAPEPGMDAAALQDLADRVEAASIAADTALAQAERLAEQLEALSQDLEAAKGQVQVLGARIESVEQAVQALNELAVLLNQDVLGLQDRVTALEKAQAEAPKVDPEEFASREEIAAVQEFAAALRTDLVGLAEQLSKLGDTLRGLSSDVAKLQGLAADIPALKTLAEANAQEIQNLNEQVALLYQDIVALQEVLSAVETLPVLREELADLKAAFERLQAELPDRVEAASIAADTALVQAQQLADQLEALAQRLEDVKGDLAALGTQVEANSQAIQVLNELAVLLNQDVLTLQDRATALEKGLADLRAQFQAIDFEEFATREDVAAVQEFVAALRSDLVNLADKVSRLEGTVGKLQTDLNGVSGRVSTLERNRLTISGSLRLRYDARDAVAGGFSGYDYDRLIAGTILSTGDADSDGQVVDDADAAINTTSGSTSALLNLTLQTGKLDARSSGGANTYPELFQFSIRLGTPNTSIGQNNPSPYDGTGTTLYPIGLAVDSLRTTLGIAQGQTLSFVFGRSVNTKFTEYVMDNESNSLGHGFVATLKGLPLGGTLTAAYGEKDPSSPNRDYFKALRLALEPFKGFSLAGSYAQHDVTFEQVGGMDGSLDLGFAKLSGEYFRYGANIFSGTYKEGAYLRAELGP
ncbi:S-layer homology domain-containing protein, partial [Thermus sp.]|uniref:S-layer homology domain-containing protein n=1 Tax=Thermus sp. TaxID=275 RepID=UPI0025F9273C